MNLNKDGTVQTGVAKIEPKTFPEGHPRIVAKDFGVHLRTIFRWIKYGWLISERGLIVTDYKSRILPDWKRSCSFKEAGNKLKVSTGTISAWRRRGIIKTIRVMGIKRPLVCSVVEIARRRKSGTFSLHQTHGLPNLVLEITGIGHLTLKKAMDQGIVPYDEIDGIKMIPNREVEKIRNDWVSSCRSIGAQKILKISKETVRRRIAKDQLKTVIVIGQSRILLKGLAKTPEERQRLKDYERLEKKKYRGRVNIGKFNYRQKKRAETAKKRAKLKQQKSKRYRAKPSMRPKNIIIPDYAPARVQVTGFETRRLTTCEEAAKATGKRTYQIKDLFRSGILRGEVVSDQTFVYIASVEALVEKIRRGILPS